jgi:ribosomal protein L29
MAWKAEQLRLKSYEDLRKLWFVLLKEKNMLYTYKELCRQQQEEMENPERIWKVKKSMARLLTVLNERKHEYLYQTDEAFSANREIIKARRKEERKKKVPHRPPAPKRQNRFHKLRKQIKYKDLRPRIVEDADAPEQIPDVHEVEEK